MSDAVVDAMQVSKTHFIAFLPEQINDVDGLAPIINEEHGAQPALLIERFAFETQFHGFTTWFDAKVGDCWIIAKLLCDGYGLRELLRSKKFFRLPLNTRKRKNAIPDFGAHHLHEFAPRRACPILFHPVRVTT